MYVLDTNVVSELRKAKDRYVSVALPNLFLSVITLLELDWEYC
jgi:predicted nucleic acid-binding protein